MNKLRWFAFFFGGAFTLVGVALYGASFLSDARAEELMKPTAPGMVRGMARVLDRNEARSMHFGLPCVAYRTWVEMRVERKKEDRKSTTVFDQNGGRKLVSLEIEGKTVFLNLDLWNQETPTRRETSLTRPHFVRRRSERGKLSYTVMESVLQEGQQVFVAGLLRGESHTLSSDPALRLSGVLVFAGSQEECLAAMRGSARGLRIFGMIFAGLGLVFFVILWNLLGSRKS